jgi:hypothetical protein
MMEIPLLVIKVEVANWISFLVESVAVSAKIVNCMNNNRQIDTNDFMIGFSEEDAKVRFSYVK